MKVSEFKIDCTPPEGTPVGFGIGTKTSAPRDSLWLRGAVLDDGVKRCVISSMDYCALMNSAYDQLVETIVNAVGTSPESVIIHCIHQHDAPLLCFELENTPGVKTSPKEWWASLLGEIAVAAKNSLDEMRSIESVGYAKTRLRGYASNRRILGKDGKVAGMRFSKCADPKLKKKPVGTIDPFLRTLAFKDSNEQIIMSWSFYATHPQVANGRNIFSADAPGEAVSAIEEKWPNSFPCFFTGLGGNVTAGKYTSSKDLEGNLKKFGNILADGISRNLNSMQWEPYNDFQLKSISFEFPRKEKVTYNSSEAIEVVDIFDAVLKSCWEYDKNNKYILNLLSIGSAKIIFFPGEPFVEYQLFAQSLAPDEFIAVVGNCSDNFLYLPLEKSFAEGGYEVDGFCWCNEKIEKELKNAIRKLLKDKDL
jgi:hypothetical protein